MIKFSAKSTITKTLILVMVSALMLSTSTYAWFSSGSAVSVEKIIASFEGPKAASTLTVKEAVDANYDGIRNIEEEYAALATDDISISQMQPNKTNFYKLEVLTTSGKKTAIVISDIQVFLGDTELTGASAQTVLENITVTLTSSQGAVLDESYSLWHYIADTSAYPYTASLVSNITDAVIYFDIGMDKTVDNNVIPGIQGVSLTCKLGLQTQSAT